MKKWGHLSSFHVFFLSYGLLFIQKAYFLQLCDYLSKKPKSTKAIYIYASDSSCYTLSENDMVYRGLIHRSWDISD